MQYIIDNKTLNYCTSSGYVESRLKVEKYTGNMPKYYAKKQNYSNYLVIPYRI